MQSPQPGMAQQAQFRQPLPPNAGVGPMPPGGQVRIMNPNMPGMQRPNGPPGVGPPGSQVGGNNPMTTRPGTFLLVHRQPSNPQQQVIF